MIKLFKAGVFPDGTDWLQSQLYVGKKTADFILKDGILKCWGSGKNGFDFYETDIKYKVFTDAKDLIIQPF